MDEISMLATSGVLIALLPLLLYIALLIFSIYFAVKVLKFMNKKAKLDEERNELLKELIQSDRQNDNKE
ncbi:hypothetical protein [Bacillus massiliigorillae]|uniref:hypothetical protein n=1 Tax=Bacillus massiliigorillae TaxID=1243664 RepID=UPI0003A68316|nr:hypothetical protein [Bacillus massiliigorillae]